MHGEAVHQRVTGACKLYDLKEAFDFLVCYCELESLKNLHILLDNRYFPQLVKCQNLSASGAPSTPLGRYPLYPTGALGGPKPPARRNPYFVVKC